MYLLTACCVYVAVQLVILYLVSIQSETCINIPCNGVFIILEGESSKEQMKAFKRSVHSPSYWASSIAKHVCGATWYGKSVCLRRV